MIFSFQRGCDRVEFDLPETQEVKEYGNTLICIGKAEKVEICVQVEYSASPRKLPQSSKPFTRLGLSGFYEIIETEKTSFYSESISFGEGKRKIYFGFFLYENSRPTSPARPIKELLEIPEIAAFLASIKSVET